DIPMPPLHVKRLDDFSRAASRRILAGMSLAEFTLHPCGSDAGLQPAGHGRSGAKVLCFEPAPAVGREYPGPSAGRESAPTSRKTPREETMHADVMTTRRSVLKLALAGSAATAAPLWAIPALAAGQINFADIGVGDPSGDWSRYTQASGYGVNLVSI